MDVWVACWITALLMLMIYLYRLLTKPLSYWEERGVPSIKALPIFGSMLPLYTKSMHDMFTERRENYGRIYGTYEGSKPTLTVAEPDLIKEILIKDFNSFPIRREILSGDKLFDSALTNLKGEQWKRVRTIMTPAFSTGKLKRMVSIMSSAADVAAKNFQQYAKSKKPVDGKMLFGAFTMDVIARSAFGTKVDSHNSPDNEFVRRARETFGGNISMKFLLFFLFPKLSKILRMELFSKESLRFFENVTLEIIKHRRRTGEAQNDFLQLMMDANDEAEKENAVPSAEEQQEEEISNSIEDLGHDTFNKREFTPSRKYKAMSHDELIAQCILFFLAGFENTASTLTFATYFLAVNPECQEKLIQEIDDVLEKNNNEFTYEAVQQMSYLENVIWETLRLFPPGVTLDRIASEDYKLGDTGITIPKDMIVTIPAYAIHHDPDFYEDPEKFDPDRFTPESRAQRNPYTYLPFGAGPRNCIGMRFVLLELKFCLAVLLSRLRFEKCAETKENFRYSKGTFFLRNGDIMLAVEERIRKANST